MIRSDEFFKRYTSHMNKQQVEAVQTVNGPILLLAVPGSGKTTVLVTRLGYMVECYHIHPRNILTLTYTIAATKDMAARCEMLFGKELADRIEFRTINGICAKIIGEYGRRIGKNPFELLNDEKQMGRIISEIYRKKIDDFPTESDIKAVKTLITYVKNMMLSSDEIAELAQEVGIPLQEIYEEYNKELRAHSRMDYDDQMLYAYKILKGSQELLEYFQNQYPYLCIDEAQDTSKIQHAIISLLAGKNRNLFMVGDEDQSIYGFRAAYPEALLNFRKNYPEAKVLLMEQNYRSTKNIVSRANAFIQKNKMRYQKNMIATKEESHAIKVIDIQYRSSQYSYLYKMATNIERETAVLYRDNESIIPLVDLLERDYIPYRIKNADLSFFTNRVVVDITNILKFIYEPDNTELFMQIYFKLQIYLKKKQAMLLCEIAREKNCAVLKSIDYYTNFEGLTMKNCKATHTHFSNMKYETPYKALNRIVKFMGYGEYLERNKINDNKIEILKMLARKEETIPDFLNRLATLQELILEKEVDYSSKLILSTIHSSKGLEYDTVYLLDVCDGIFPDKIVNNYEKVLPEEIKKYEEERRLFYVAMTRAKNYLILFQIQNMASTFVREVKPIEKSKKLPIAIAKKR